MVVPFYKWLVMVSFRLSVLLNVHPVVVNDGQVSPFHPFHVSVAEINHNAAEKTLEISCKIFTDDFSEALTKKYKTTVDLVHPTDKAAMDKIISDYISLHLQVKTDDKVDVLKYLGFEVESEAVYVYLQSDNIASVKKAEITDSILHDLFSDQTEIIHLIVGGVRKSVKVDYPNSLASFQF